MKDSQRCLIAIWILLAGTVAAHAISGSASGTINAGSDENDATASISGAWGGVFVCAGGTCDVTGTPCNDFSDCDAGAGDTACVPLGNGLIVQDPVFPNEFFTFFFDVLPPGPAGQTQTNLGFQFDVDLTASVFSAEFTITGESTQTGGGSEGGSVTFFIPRPPPPSGALPILGLRWVIVLVAGLLAAGVFFIVRRIDPDPLQGGTE